MQFKITEDNLANAIFYGARLNVTGNGTKAEARQQARKMLAAGHLLIGCKVALGYIDENEDLEGECPLCGGIADGLPYHAKCPCKPIRDGIYAATK